MSKRKRKRNVLGRLRKALKKWEEMERKNIKKTEDFLCSVSLEILEVTSLSARLLRQTSENIFQGKEMRPHILLGGGLY